MNKYSICFLHKNGIDSCDILRDTDILSDKDIEDIQTFIEKRYKFENVIIKSFNANNSIDKNTIFNQLNSVNVSEKIEKKGELKYLSWSYAWEHVKKKYNSATYSIKMFDGKPYLYDENLGYMVFTEVSIMDEKLTMFLPVLDGRNKSLKKETCSMFDINKALMRCLTKNLAMFGLGLNLYAGEDLPLGAEIEKDPITFISEYEELAELARMKKLKRKQVIDIVKLHNYNLNDIKKQFELLPEVINATK